MNAAVRVPWPVPVALAGAATAAVAWAAESSGDTVWATGLVGGAHLALGLIVFLRHGGRRITATGIYFMATGLLTGGAVLVVVHRTEFLPELWLVVLASFVAHLGLLVLRAQPGRPHGRVPVVPVEPPGGPARWLWPVGAGYLAVAFVLRQFTPPALHSAPAFVAVLLFALAALQGYRQRYSWRSVPELLVAALAFGLYLEFFFSGSGRLTPVNLALCIALLVNRPRPTAWHKRLAVAAVVPLLLVAGVVRAGQFGGDGSFEDVVQTQRGLGSIVNPVDLFAEVVHADRTASESALDRAYGRTFAVAAVAAVPRALWPGKPVSFGTELSEALRPLAPEGHSLAALLGAEMFVNFGWLGLALLAIGMAWVLRRLDRLLGWYVDRPAAGLVVALLVVVVSAALMDLVWGGSFTFAARGLIRVAFLVPLLGARVLADRRRTPQPAAIAS